MYLTRDDAQNISVPLITIGGEISTNSTILGTLETTL